MRGARFEGVGLRVSGRQVLDVGLVASFQRVLPSVLCAWGLELITHGFMGLDNTVEYAIYSIEDLTYFLSGCILTILMYQEGNRQSYVCCSEVCLANLAQARSQ